MGEVVGGYEGLLLRRVNVVFGHLEEPIGLAAQSAWMGAVGSKLL